MEHPDNIDAVNLEEFFEIPDSARILLLNSEFDNGNIFY
jgi:hypothetical protein